MSPHPSRHPVGPSKEDPVLSRVDGDTEDKTVRDSVPLWVETSGGGGVSTPDTRSSKEHVGVLGPWKRSLGTGNPGTITLSSRLVVGRRTQVTELSVRLCHR